MFDQHRFAMRVHFQKIACFLLLYFFIQLTVWAQGNEAERIRKWREDLRYFREQVPAYDKTFTPVLFSNGVDSNKLHWAIKENNLKAFLEGTDSLYNMVPQLNDEQIMIGMSKLMALSPNAHTRLYLFRVRTVMNNLPIGLWWFQDTLRIVSAPPSYKEIIGSRVLYINEHSVHEVKVKVDELISGNRQWEKYMSLYFLRSPQAMKGLSLTNEGAFMHLKVMTLEGKEKVFKMNADFVPQKATLEAWKDLSPVTTKKDSLMHLLGTTSKKLPLYLQQVDKDYSYRYLEKDQTLYLQFNRAAEMPGLTFLAMVENIITDMKGKNIRKFIFDVRFNTGGSYEVAVDALNLLAPHLTDKKNYLIISNATFSAGIIPAAMFKQLTGAKVIGESAADDLLFMSEGGNLILPHSKIVAHYANGILNWTIQKGFTLKPDKMICVQFKDYLNGEDTILNYILSD